MPKVRLVTPPKVQTQPRQPSARQDRSHQPELYSRKPGDLPPPRPPLNQAVPPMPSKLTVAPATIATSARGPTPARVACVSVAILSPARPSTSVMSLGPAIPPAAPAPTRTRQTARPATTATPARRPTPARAGSAQAATPSPALPPISVTTLERVIPPLAHARTRPRPTGRPATTATPAPRPTPARVAPV